MIVKISEQFQKISGRIYTFSLIAVALKFLPIEAVTQLGMKITITDTEIITGALGLVTAMLTAAAIFCLLRDYISTLVSDSVEFAEHRDLTREDFLSESLNNQVFAEKYFGIYSFLAWTAFLIEGLFPLMLGLLISWMTRLDMVVFIREITI